VLVVEREMAGFECGRNLSKVGMAAQDTSELFFDDVVVLKANLLGEEGGGFASLMRNLPQERLPSAMTAAAGCVSVLDMCLDHATQRKAFGRSIGSFQHTGPCSPRWRRRLTCAASSSTTACAATTPVCWTRPVPRWLSGGPPRSRRRSSAGHSGSDPRTMTDPVGS
jgi:hypothetical protein